MAESVFIAGLFVFVGPDYAEICRMRGLDDVATDAEDKIDNMRDITLTHGFDGDWFLRAYDHYGDKIGSKENEEGQIFIEPQGICVMAGIGVENGEAQRHSLQWKSILIQNTVSYCNSLLIRNII